MSLLFHDIFPISFAQAFIIPLREEFSAYQRENLLGKQRVESVMNCVRNLDLMAVRGNSRIQLAKVAHRTMVCVMSGRIKS